MLTVEYLTIVFRTMASQDVKKRISEVMRDIQAKEEVAQELLSFIETAEATKKNSLVIGLQVLEETGTVQTSLVGTSDIAVSKRSCGHKGLNSGVVFKVE